MRIVIGLMAVLAAAAALAQPLTRIEPAPRRAPAGQAPAAGPISGPTVITKSGSYVVVRPISAAGTVIEIEASDVRLDLNGFVVESTTSTSPTINVKQANTLRGVTVSGGSVRGGSACVFMDRTVHSSLSSVIATGCPGGVLFDDNEALTVENNRIGSFDQPTPLIFDDCQNCTIDNNTVIGGLLSGLLLAHAEGGQVSNNKVWSSLECFHIGGDGVRIKDNVAHDCGDAMKVDAEFSLIENNQLSSAGTGLTFGVQSRENVYRGNVARDIFGGPFTDNGTGNTSAGDNYLPDRR